MEEGEQRRGEEMGLTVKQRRAVMNELRGQYLHTPPHEKSRILDGFVDQGASQPFVRTQHPASKGNAGNSPVHHPRASVYKGVVLPALTEFWHLSDRLCGKRLVPFLQRIIPSPSPGDSLTLLLLSVTSFSA